MSGYLLSECLLSILAAGLPRWWLEVCILAIIVLVSGMRFRIRWWMGVRFWILGLFPFLFLPFIMSVFFVVLSFFLSPFVLLLEGRNAKAWKVEQMPL